jgi:carboxyl-terminal processing protease
MNYKMPVPRAFPSLRPAAAAAGLFLLAAFAAAQTADKATTDFSQVKSDVLTSVTKIISTAAFVPGIDFDKLPQFLTQEKAKIDAAQNPDDFARAVNEALEKFGASHVVLLTPETSEIRNTGSTVGIGITSQVNADGSVVVIRTIPDTPAADADLVPGDVITMVDDKKADGIKGIRGPEGSKVKIQVKKQDGQVVDLTLTRRKFSTARPEELTWLERDTVKLSVFTFDYAYNGDRVSQLVSDAMEKHAKNIVIDLRDNGGGAVVNLEQFLSLFIPDEKPIGTMISKVTLDRYVQETGGNPTDLQAIANWSKLKLTPRSPQQPVFKGKIVVLINQFSGSAAEMAAAALRDTVGAEVIGTKSAGAVLVSIIRAAADDYMLQYPLCDYITIKGQRLEGTGVTPDVVAKDPRPRLPDSPDAPVEKALAYLEDPAKFGVASAPSTKG